MTSRRISLFALVLLTSVPLAANQVAFPAPPQIGQPRAEAQPTTGTSSIVGRVVDASSGQPLDGVRVQLSGSSLRGGHTTYSDDDGRFAFANLPAGEVTLRGSKTGYVSVAYGQKVAAAGRSGTPIDLLPGQELKDITLAIPKGGVVTGIVFDEKGRPTVGTPVRVMRWSMASGERTLSQVGSETTDDRGIYRVYGLAPGDYVVSAIPRNQMTQMSMEVAMLLDEQAHHFEVVTSGGGISVAPFPVPPTPEAVSELEPLTGYAPVYYPGTTRAAGATTIRLGLSEERGGTDFQLSRVALARVEGAVIMPPGLSVSSVQVRLVELDDETPGLNRPTTRADREGKFTFPGVPPGRYRAMAVANLRSTPVAGRQGGPAPENQTLRMWAALDITVDGSNVSNLSLVLQNGVSVSGRLVYDGRQPVPPAGSRVRLSLGPFGSLTSALGGSSSTVTVGADGRFTFTGVIPGQYRVRSVSGASGWSLGSAMIAGRDSLDFAIDVEGGQDITGLDVTLTDRTSSLSGTLQDSLGRATADYTVIIFPSDNRYWQPLARRIRSTRPSTTGKFSLTGLPAGEYRLAAVTDVESGQWYDPSYLQQLQAASIAVTLLDGQSRTQDLRVAGQ